jgi:prepilin-type N-terminal cleavage/methylation domain-containing protein
MRLPEDDRGLTLVELLVATAISALIIPVITGALVVGWKTTGETIVRLGDNRNRQIVSSMLTRDAQNATAVSTAASGCTVGSDAVLLVLTWDEPQDSGATTPQKVAWVKNGSYVERRHCDPSSSAYSVLAAAHDITSARAECPAALTDAWTNLTCTATSRFIRLEVTDSTGTFVATGRRRQLS